MTGTFKCERFPSCGCPEGGEAHDCPGRIVSDDKWGPWIPWSGGGCPIPDAKAWEFELRRGDNSEIASTTDASGLHWGEFGKYPHFTIIAYRVRIPADDLLRQAVEALRTLQRQALQSSVNDGNEWGQEALEMTRAVLGLAAKRGM